MARVLSDEGGNVSLRAFVALFNDQQLVHELLRVYDLDRDGVCNPTELQALTLEWLGVGQDGSAILLSKHAADSSLGLTTAELLALVQEGNESSQRGLPEGVPPAPAAPRSAA